MNIPNLKFEVGRHGLSWRAKKKTKGKSSNDVPTTRIMQPFGPNIWYVDGPDVDFYGFPYPTRMVVIKIENTTTAQNRQQQSKSTKSSSKSKIDIDKYCSWIWSPIEYTDELAKHVEETVGGPVRYIVSPNKIHWLSLKEWSDRFPLARVYASPGLCERSNVIANNLDGIEFDSVLTNTPEPEYSNEIDQIIFQCGSSRSGSSIIPQFDEVVFLHKQSRTVIFTDLIQRFPMDRLKGFKGWLLEMDGLGGTSGGAPRELRMLIRVSNQMYHVRQQLNIVLEQWSPDQLIIAHGLNAESNATAIVAHSFRWVPEHPPTNNCICFCIPSSRKNNNDNNNNDNDNLNKMDSIIEEEDGDGEEEELIRNNNNNGHT